MTVTHILSLLGGLALFLYGMHMMSTGLEETAGDKMKNILEKLTRNRFLGVLVGALITAVIQSSSATTVMVVGFVNSGLMTLRQAIWIIMGANIGTTITGQLVALNISELAPILAIVGVIFVTFIRNKKINNIGTILAGLGILFIGMGMMSDAMYPLRESQSFIQLITTISNPFIAIVVGTAFTALIQSSSASVGILQTLANSGLIPLSSSIYIIFGQNIGTCITSVLASISANRAAKRTTIIHLSFNLIGTVLFMIAIQFIPFVDWMVALTDVPAAQIANTHTIFNIVTTLVLLPFGNQLATLAEKILPVLDEEKEDALSSLPLTFVTSENIGNASIAIASLKKEATFMLELTRKNINDSFDSLLATSPNKNEKILIRENRINLINVQITEYMSKVSMLHMSEQDSNTTSALYKCFSDIERIGDYAVNLVHYGTDNIKNIEVIEKELKELKQYINDMCELLFISDLNQSHFDKLCVMEEKIDQLTSSYRKNQIKRLTEGVVEATECIRYSQIMTDIERIGDHIMNIMKEYYKVQFTIVKKTL
ncbi:Na/Pi cotransporter family protein [Floccifex sp.]|uniref:Na/Pi cotransporter family protein n=1 Tax=Floccifex sp. TaxID=2815810 RepID=UPI003F0518EE